MKINAQFLLKIWNTTYKYIIIGCVGINLILAVVNLVIWGKVAQEKYYIAADFTNFYTTFSIVRSGEGTNLYDQDIMARYQVDFLEGRTIEGGVLPLAYPPFLPVIFSPLSFLPLSTAYYIWTLGQLGLLIWLIYLFNRLFSDWDKRELQCLTFAIIAFWPLAITFLSGQVSLFILVGMLQLYIAMKNVKLTHAGIWLALMSIKPQTILIPGMMSINKRYIRAAGYAAIIFIALVLFSAIFIGFEPWIDYARMLPTMSNYFGKYGFYPDTFYSLRGVLSSLLGYNKANVINSVSNIALILGMVIVLKLWMPDVIPGSPKFKLTFAFTIALSVFFNLHLYSHDSLTLVLPAVLFYDYLRQMGYPRKAYSLLLLISPLIFFISAFNSFNLFGFIRPPVVVILILLGWMITYLIKDFKMERSRRIATLSSASPT